MLSGGRRSTRPTGPRGGARGPAGCADESQVDLAMIPLESSPPQGLIPVESRTAVGRRCSARAVLLAACVGVAVAGCASPGGGGGTNGGGTPGTGTIVGSLKPGSVAAAYLPWVNKAGSMCASISAPLIAAQIQQESGWNPNAVSPVGAQGIAQFMPGTWASYKNDADGTGKDSPFDPADAITAQGHLMCDLAARVIKDLAAHVISGTLIELVLGGYNAGIGAVEAQGGVPKNAQTQQYVQVIPQIAIASYGGAWSQPASTGGGAGGGSDAAIATFLQGHLGIPYVWGGGTLTGPSGVDASSGQGPGFDCSSFSRYGVYQASGGKLTLPRTAAAQQSFLAGHEFAYTSVAALQPGDLLFYGVPAEHVAVYVGGGQLVQEPHPSAFSEVVPVFPPTNVARIPAAMMKGGN